MDSSDKERCEYGVACSLLRLSDGRLRVVHWVTWLAMLCLHAPVVLAQTSSATMTGEPCDKACQRQKVDTLFRAMDEAETVRHPKPSNSNECVAYNGNDLADVLVDVCAKLKYVRAPPLGTERRFACPRNTERLVGLSPSRIRSIWGEPDFEVREKWGDPSSPLRRWTYFIGSSKDGGFPELSLHFNGALRIESVTCALSK